MTTEQIIEEEMELIRADVVKFYIQSGMRASGQFENETVVAMGNRKATIDAPSYATQLIRGRRPGAMPPIQAIERWIRNKGIRPLEAKTSISSLAYLIARKIQREGTEYFKQGGTDLLDSVLTPQRMQRILNRLSDYNLSELTQRITKTLKDAA